MKSGGTNRIALVTCGTLREARRIAREAVANRLAACVNVLTSPVESFYTWKGKPQNAREYLLIIKTTAASLVELEAMVAKMHSYDLPEFIVLPIVAGSNAYLDWLRTSLKPLTR